jgi:hypothetical protein
MTLNSVSIFLGEFHGSTALEEEVVEMSVVG